MKVIHYYDRFKPMLGGVETHIENLVKMPGIDFEVLTNAIPDLPTEENLSKNTIIRRIGPNDRTIKPFNNKGISKATFPYRSITDIIRNKRKINYLKQTSYNVLHVHGPALSMNLQRLDRWFERTFFTRKLDFTSIEKPKILTMHGLFSPFTSNPFAEDYERRLINMFEHVLCVDNFILEKLVSYGRNDAILIPNSINTELFKYTPHLKGKKLKLGFVGRVDDEISGLKLMIKLIQEKLPFLDISIIGAGTQNNINRFKTSINNKNVKFIQNLAPERIPEYLSNINILLNPVQTGAITRVTLESMSCGRPVIMIGKDKKGPIINHDTGYLIDYNIETLIGLLTELNDNKELVINTGKNARKKVENEYSNDVILPKVSKIYETLVK